ncbi:MAG TPA: hypothetical protein VLX90_20075 [Steroidobacteraceae bacterium]|nr:hypothetical protein [Steroidobacteraceae bacterium]
MAAELLEVDVNERLARLESDVVHLRSDIGELRADVGEQRAVMDSFRKDFDEFRVDMSGALGSLRTWGLALTGMLLSVLARGFHWI